MADTEKLTNQDAKYFDEPLVLRPPVGGEVFKGLGPYKNEAVRRSAICWPRSRLLRIMLVCVLLAIIAGCVFVIFALQHSTWPWGRAHSHEVRGFCHAITPFPGIDFDENFAIDSAGVMVSHAAVAGFPAMMIFHLLGNEGMSVMLAEDNCYVFPITPDVSEAVSADDGLVKRIEESNYRLQFKVPIMPKVFVLSQNGQESFRILHDSAANMCSGRLIFRLTEMVPSQTAVRNDSSNAEQDCPKECPAGESRDSNNRKVCRCPPNFTMPPLPQSLSGPIPADSIPIPEADATADDVAGPIDDLDDGEDDGDDDFQDDVDADLEDEMVLGEGLPSEIDSLVHQKAWFPEKGAEVERVRRSVDAIHHIDLPVQVPPNCKVDKQILGGVIPGDPKHSLPLMTIVKC